MPAPLRSGPDDDLGLDWDRLADGRVWRLRRGSDYAVDNAALTSAADVAAGRLGKVACVAAESLPRMRRFDDYAWVQFVDHDVLLGQPCPCGSRELVRRHPRYARCPACGASLRLSPPRGSERFADDESAGPEARARARQEASRAKAIARGNYRCKYDERFALELYEDVLFLAAERRPRRERLYGRAVDPLGMPVLIWVQYPLSEGQRMAGEDGEPGEVCHVHRWPVAPFPGLIDLGRVPALGAHDLPEGDFASAHSREDRRGGVGLDRFTEVHLPFGEQLPGRERRYGHARDADGRPCLIYVDYRVMDGGRVGDPDHPGSQEHQVYRWPVEPFGEIIDLAAISG